MTAQNPLIVPIVVEAMLANDTTRTSPDANNGITFWRTTMDYPGLRRYHSAEPTGSTGNDPNFDQAGQQGDNDWSTFYNGIYLKWRLPAALRRGVQDGASATTTFPLVPNRWLVIRTAGLAGPGGAPASRTATAWIVQSDYQASTLPTAASYADVPSVYWGQTADGTPGVVLLGLTSPLNSSWSEPGTPMFLTAIAPGNPAFSVSQTDGNNVFSMFDPLALAGTADQTVLSYHVIGWYSDPTQDPLAAATGVSFAGILQSLGWTLPASTDSALVATSSVYSGFLGGIVWQSETALPAGPPSGVAPTVGIGNTSVEALTAILTLQAQDVQPPPPPLDPELLEAFQYDLLGDYEKPDGPDLVAQDLHDAGFQRFAGGYGWQIVDAPGDWPPVSAAELANEAQWLAQLNQNQAAFDAAQRALAALQYDLYSMWWKWASWRFTRPEDPPSGLTQETLGQQLDPTVAGSLAAQVQAQAGTVGQLGSAVPQGTTQAQLAAAIAAYAAQQALPPSRVLKRLTLPRFSLANPPVVVVSGAGAAGIYNPQGTLVCRFPGQLVTGFVDASYSPQPITAATAGLAIPAPAVLSVAGGPSAAVTQSLITEAFFLDPANAGIVAAAIAPSPSAQAVGVVAAAMTSWTNAVPAPPPTAGALWPGRNPWRPLFLYWQAQFVPIPFGTPTQPDWTFNGTSYDWNGDEPPTPEIGLDGRILLTPQATLNVQAQIAKFLATNPSFPEATEFQDLLAFIAANDGVKGEASADAPWDLLSQALTGFNEQLLQRQAGAFPSPNAASPAPPALYGHAPGFPPDPQGAGDFQPWRAGQFYFTELMIVDEWGQSLTIVDAGSFADAAIARPADMTPVTTIAELPADSVVALPPALLQPGRLNFQLVSAVDDSAVDGLAPAVDPICGWVVPNHLDHALMAYDADGAALGELSVGAEASGAAMVWTPAPGATSPTIPSIPHLGAFLTALLQGSVADFRDFLAGIDETLWTTQPAAGLLSRNLAVLIGRPLAMVRARLLLELDGPAATDPSWSTTFAPSPSPAPTWPFAIELGNLARIDDGLIGYFVGDDYQRFNIVTASGSNADGYLQPIGVANNYIFATFYTAPFPSGAETYVSLLVDPRAPVHATTAILPTVTIAVPPDKVAAALAKIDVTFRVGPLLTEQAEAAGASGPTILLPLPAAKDGTWSWQQQDQPGAWTPYPVGAQTAQAKLSPTPPVLRRGLLHLTKPLG